MKLESKDRTYRLKGRKAPLSFIINSRHSKIKPLLYFDGKTNRPLRYSSNQKSPFQDEQDDSAILEPVVFEGGMLFVPKNNPVLQEFLYYHPGNGKLFEEIDNEKNAQEDVEKLDFELEAQLLARELDIDTLETIARVSLGLRIDKMTSAEIKRDVRNYAKRYPKDFLVMVNDPALKLQNLAHKLFDEKLITSRNNDKEIYYNLSSNKKRLITVPFGQSPVEAMVDFFKTNDGIEVMQMLEKALE
jgi:hypothetical protein